MKAALTLLSGIVLLVHVPRQQTPAAPSQPIHAAPSAPKPAQLPPESKGKADAFQPCTNVPDKDTGLTGCQQLALHDLMQQEEPLLLQLQPIDNALRSLQQQIAARVPGSQFEQPSQRYPQGRLIPAGSPSVKSSAKQ